MDRQEKKKLESEKKRIRAYQEKVKEKVENSPKLKCTFVNLESKGVDLDFTYEGLYKYRLVDGWEHVLPLCIIEHLNSLKVPVMKYKTDPASGQLVPDTEVKQMLQRFSVTPTNLTEYTEVMKGGTGKEE